MRHVFAAIFTIGLSITAAMTLRTWRETSHIENLQTNQRRDIDSLKVEADWCHAAINRIHR